MHLYMRRTEVLLLFSVTIAIPPRIDLNTKIQTCHHNCPLSPVKVQIVVSPGDPLWLLWCRQGCASQVDVTSLLNKNIPVSMNFCLKTFNYNKANVKKKPSVMWPAHHDNVIIIKCKKSTILAFTAK